MIILSMLIYIKWNADAEIHHMMITHRAHVYEKYAPQMFGGGGVGGGCDFRKLWRMTMFWQQKYVPATHTNSNRLPHEYYYQMDWILTKIFSSPERVCMHFFPPNVVIHTKNK